MVKKMKSDFLSKNIGFVISQIFPFLLGRTQEEIISKYFTDASNKENFTKMILPSIRNQA